MATFIGSYERFGELSYCLSDANRLLAWMRKVIKAHQMGEPEDTLGGILCKNDDSLIELEISLDDEGRGFTLYINCKEAAHVLFKDNEEFSNKAFFSLYIKARDYLRIFPVYAVTYQAEDVEVFVGLFRAFSPEAATYAASYMFPVSNDFQLIAHPAP